MPTIDELNNKNKKKFIKSEYRPWNYMGQIEQESNENKLEIKKESISSQLEIKSKLAPVKPTFLETRDNNQDQFIKYNEQSNLETTLDLIFRLTGHQKKIFIFIVEKCMSRGLLTSGVVNGDALTELTGTTLKMAKTSIQRLEAKGLIIRENGKRGRGGFYLFSVTEIVRNALIEYKRMVGIGNHIEINNKSNENQFEPLNINEIIKKNTLPIEWELINIEPLDSIGFNKNHLMDIYEPKLCEPQMVQESIMHFAYGVEYEQKKFKQYDDLLKVFIGRLRKGKPWYESSYRSPQEIAQQQMLENKKAELDRKKKVEEDLFKISFAEWLNSLNDEEKSNLISKNNKTGDFTPVDVKLSLYFKENIWPMKKSECLISD